jgi:hypothetical protein
MRKGLGWVIPMLLRVIAIWVLAWSCAPRAEAQSSWSNGYAFRRAVTIDHIKVPNTDQVNFPVLISGTYGFLATISNGGDVISANGYDIIFTSDVAGTTILPFEQASYSASTGAVNYWVQVPALSHTADTVIYLFYGNGGISSDQSNKTAVWDTNYKGVWHLANGSTLSANDSTSSGNNGTIYGATATAGIIDGAASFGGSQAISMTANASSQPSNLTLSFWFNRGASSQANYGRIVEKGTDQNGSPYGSYFVRL